MLVRDLRTGRVIAVPDNHIFASRLGGYQFGSYAPGSVHGLGDMPGFGHYGAAPGQIIYDGLGNPLGLPFLAALAPLAGKALALLPMIAGKAGALLPALAGKVGGALPSASSLLPQITSAATPVLPMTSTGAMAQGMPQMPQGMPEKMMASQSMQPMQPPIQPWVQPSMPAQMPSPTQPSMAPISPPSAEPPGGLPVMTAREEVVVAPMRVQQPNGETVVVPVRLRRRRRSRRGRLVRIQPVSFGPRPAESPRNLQGWLGFNGWRGY